jgi:hypothetical protein
VPEIVKRPVRPQELVGAGEHGVGGVVVQRRPGPSQVHHSG